MGRYTVHRTAKAHKYGAVATEVDGIRFASKAEATRYWHLKLLQKAGEICGLQTQLEFDLFVQGIRIGGYRADFTYMREGKMVVEDVKGVKTALYKWKKKHVEAQYGITITEITR